MSLETEQEFEERRSIRRSFRIKKGVVDPSVSETSSGSETESVEGEVNLVDTDREWSIEILDGTIETSMSRREHGNKDSKDSSRGLTLNPGMADLLQMMLEDNRRRDEEQKRRDEMDRLRKDEERRRKEEETQRRDEEMRSNRAQQQQLIESLVNRREAPEQTRPPAVFYLPRMRNTDELEEFIPVFETSLRVNDVPRPLLEAKVVNPHILKIPCGSYGSLTFDHVQ